MYFPRTTLVGDYADQGERGNVSPEEPKILAYSDGQGYLILPNPNNGNFVIEQMSKDEEPVYAEVLSATGIRVYMATLLFGNSKASIKLGSVSSGLYLLKLSNSKGQYVLKFNVQ